MLQITSPEVDVLWVVDNSCSMSEEQEAIASNFPQFMEYFLDSSLDYHIGVVSTDMDDPQQSGLLRPAGGGMRWIDTETDDALARFADLTLFTYKRQSAGRSFVASSTPSPSPPRKRTPRV